MKKRVVLWVLSVVLFALCVLPPMARAADNTPRLVFGEGQLSPAPAPSDQADGGFRALTLPIRLQNVPETGVCGVLLWVSMTGRGGTPAVQSPDEQGKSQETDQPPAVRVTSSLTAGVGAGDTQAPSTDTVTLTYAVSAADGGLICGILLDSKENFTLPTDGEVCRISLILPVWEAVTLTLVEGSFTCINGDGIPCDGSTTLSLPYYMDKNTSDSPPDGAVAEIETETETEVHTAQPSAPPENDSSPTLATATPVGVQDTAAQSRREGSTSYAVRFLFMSPEDGERTGASAVCLSGGGVLKLSFAVKECVLICVEGVQVSVPPPCKGARWITYTFEGLSFDAVYEFEIDGGDGKRERVVYREGKCEMYTA